MNKKYFFYLFILTIVFLVISCNVAGDTSSSGESNTPAAASNFYQSVTEASSDGVIAYWNMDEESGTTAANSMATGDGTAGANTQIKSGKFGNAREFYYNLANSNIDISSFSSTAQTYSFYFWLNVSTQIQNTYIFDSLSGRLAIYFGATPRYYLYLNDGTVKSYICTLPTTLWICCVITFDKYNEESKLYINGEYVDSQVYAAKNITGATRIGSSNTGTAISNVNAKIDDFAVWNRVLSTKEIADLYSRNKALIAK